MVIKEKYIVNCRHQMVDYLLTPGNQVQIIRAGKRKELKWKFAEKISIYSKNDNTGNTAFEEEGEAGTN